MTLVAPSHLDGRTSVDVVVPGALLEVVGRIDSRSAYDVRLLLDEAIVTGSGDLVVDMRLAEVHDSAGLGMLVGAHRRAALAERRLVVAHPSERLVRLTRQLPVARGLHLVA